MAGKSSKEDVLVLRASEEAASLIRAALRGSSQGEAKTKEGMEDREIGCQVVFQGGSCA